MTKSVQSLEDLTRMTLDAELAQLKVLSGEINDRRAEIEAMKIQRAKRARMVETQGVDLAFQSGQDARWLDWMAREQARLNLDLAHLAARWEAQRAVASRAFGRVEALAELGWREAEERRVQAARRETSLL